MILSADLEVYILDFCENQGVASSSSSFLLSYSGTKLKLSENRIAHTLKWIMKSPYEYQRNFVSNLSLLVGNI